MFSQLLKFLGFHLPKLVYAISLYWNNYYTEYPNSFKMETTVTNKLKCGNISYTGSQNSRNLLCRDKNYT